jgi:DNA-binding LacI/PurR family transcriptional regulator
VTTIKDTAKKAGAPVRMVDRALNNRSRISPEAKQQSDSIVESYILFKESIEDIPN